MPTGWVLDGGGSGWCGLAGGCVVEWGWCGRFGSRGWLAGTSRWVGLNGRMGEQDGSLGPVQPPLRRLLRARAPDLFEGVGVGVVDGDVAVAVGVGSAGTDALDERAGEHRSTGGVLALQRLALEGVLRPPGGRQHDPSPALPDQPLADAQIVVALGSLGERATEAAVQDHHLLARPAVLELVEQPVRLDARGRQPVLDGVTGSEVQTAPRVHQAMA